MWFLLEPTSRTATKRNDNHSGHLGDMRPRLIGRGLSISTMFHVERHDLWLQIARHSVHTPPEDFIEKLERYREWLLEEAIPAGGLGPAESERVDERHIADSLLFSLLTPKCERALDIGTGAGLPGVPLAILMPETRFVLLDRSGKRVHLVKRATRVLDLGNVDVIQDSVSDFSGRFPVVVSRATIPPDLFLSHLKRLLQPGGVGLLGGSWEQEPVYEAYEREEIGSTILDQPVWILIMRQSE